jgi:ankyrin repeat protein
VRTNKSHLFSFSLLLALIVSGCERKSDDLASIEEDAVRVVIDKITIDKAVARGDFSAVQALIESNPDLVNRGSRPDMPPLLSAILRKKVEIAKLLILKGADVCVTDSSSRTATHLAVDRNLPQLIPLLAEKGAGLNELDSVGWTPLHWAAAKDRIDAAKALIEAGADVHVISELGGSVLHEAASSGSADMIQLLIDAEVDPNVIAKDGGRALDVALKYENEAAVQLLEPITRPLQ